MKKTTECDDNCSECEFKTACPDTHCTWSKSGYCTCPEGNECAMYIDLDDEPGGACEGSL